MAAQGAVRHRVEDGLPADIAFLGSRINPRILAAAALEAGQSGAAAHEILIANGHISTIDYYRALATAVGARFTRFVRIETPVDPLAGRDPGAALQVGMLKVAGPEGIEFAAAPRGPKVARFVEALQDRRAASQRIFVTPPQALTDAVAVCGKPALMEGALTGLGKLPDALSARTLLTRAQIAALILAALAMAGLAMFDRDAAVLLLSAVLALFFFGAIGIRVVAAVLGLLPDRGDPRSPLADKDLPLYTILVPLYHEAGQVDRLLDALGRLDYPRHRLDIKMIAEADDVETVAALRRRDLPGCFEILTVPAAEPRTKPKALCYALAFARGSLLTIYDAEDLPAPDQLRCAAERFAASGPDVACRQATSGPDVACLQARLAWYNWPETWFTRQMALEYASLFDALLPGLARLGLPLPLGGTSNHFRIDALRQVGAWDAYNVTEDADLGLRLAREGYRCGVLRSTTWEEAPVSFRAWLRQRTRWLKGWMQVYLVHMRAPAELIERLGLVRFLAVQAVFGGMLASVFVHPVFMAVIAFQILRGDVFLAEGGLVCSIVNWLGVFNFLAGYCAGLGLAVVGLMRRPMWWLVPELALLPFYWLIMSAAAVRAVWQVAVSPHHWDKTPHGLSAMEAAPPVLGLTAIRIAARTSRARLRAQGG